MTKKRTPRSPVTPSVPAAKPSAPAPGRRRCKRCSRFIPASGPSRCARCAGAEALMEDDPLAVSTGPMVTEQPTAGDLGARDGSVRAAPPVPQPRPSDVPIPARSWPPKPAVAPRQVQPPTMVGPPRASANDFVIPLPSQLHTPMSVAPMQSGVLLPRIRPATGLPTPTRRSRWTYVIGTLMIAAGLAIGVLIPFAGQLVRL